MGKGKSDDHGHKGSKDPAPKTCSGCKNFKPGKGGIGRCARRDKKRDAKDKACGHFDPR